MNMKALSILLLLLLQQSHLAEAKDPIVIPPIIDATAIDQSVNPCQDFYRFACGNWLKTFKLPADKPMYYRQDSGLADKADETLENIIIRYTKGDFSVPSKGAQKLATFYSSCMNEKQISADSLATVKDMVTEMRKMKTAEDLANTLARLHLAHVNGFFSFGGGQDLNDSTRVIGFADEGGLSLPDKSYYFPTDAKGKETVTKFKKHVEKMLRLFGETRTTATHDAALILNLETRLAKHAMDLADRQDSTKINHPSNREGLKTLAPEFPWDIYFKALGATQVKDLNVNEPEFYKSLNEVLKTTPMDDLKVYLEWHILKRFAPSMEKKFDREHFQFWEKYLAGTKEQDPRGKRCTEASESALVDALGEAYVSTVSADAIKSATKSMLDEIISVFEKDLKSLTWLDDGTRAAALKKLAKVHHKIGYPEKWRSYASLELNSNYVLNDTHQAVFNSHFYLDKIGKPVDLAEWDMAPWEVNAYYDSSRNELVLPIGELLPPVFDLKASDGTNYGSLGATTIGHELTHGFDSDGSQYDGNGNLKDWWSPAVRAEFNKRTQCLVDQADKYRMLPGLNVDGKLTLTENLADQGGMKLALEALEKILAKARRNTTAESSWHGYNEMQQYFISFGQTWCAKLTDEKLRLQIKTNVHPPPEYRVNGVLFNRPEFAQAFGCKEGDKMSPKISCAVW